MDKIKKNTKAKSFKYGLLNVPAIRVIAPSVIFAFTKKQLQIRFRMSFDISKIFLNVD